MAKADAITTMTKDELDALQVLIDIRRNELKREEYKELSRKLFLGSKVLYKNKKEQVVGEVNSITPDYISVALEVEENGCKNRRIGYDKIIDFIAE